MKGKSYINFGILLTLENVILGIIKFIFSIILVKKFGSQFQGEYSYLNTIASYFVIFSISLVDQTNIVRVSKIKAIIPKLQSYIGTACIVGLISITLTTIGLYTLFQLDFLNKISIPVVYIIGYAILFSARQIFRSMILATEKYLLHSSTNILIEISLLLLLFFVNTFTQYIQYSLMFISFAAIIYFINLLIKINFKINYSHSEFLNIIKYGSKMLTYVIMQTILLRIDVFFIMYFYNSKLLSYYMISTAFAELINLPSKSITSIILNKTIHQQQNIESKIFRIINTMNWAIFVGVLLFGILFIPKVYGEEYGKYIYIFIIQAFGALIVSYTYIYSYYLIGKENHKSVVNSYAISTFVSLILYYLLTKNYSILGASIASTLSYLCIMVSMLYYLKKKDELFKNLKIILPTIETYHFIIQKKNVFFTKKSRR